MQGCLSSFPINTIFDDEGLASGSCFDLASVERVQPIIFPGLPGPYLSGFDGLDASGIGTLRIEDQSPGVDGGIIMEVGIEILIDMPVIDGVILAEKVPAEYLIANRMNEAMLNTRGEKTNTDFILFQNEPNPFYSTTWIKYELPANQMITFSVFDIMGRMIFNRQFEATKGLNSLIIQPEDITAQGVL